jgi:hypothetical protein
MATVASDGRLMTWGGDGTGEEKKDELMRGEETNKEKMSIRPNLLYSSRQDQQMEKSNFFILFLLAFLDSQ